MPVMAEDRLPPEAAVTTAARNEATDTATAWIEKGYGNIPLYFIKNDGQIDSRVKFYEKGAGHAVYFTDSGVYLSLSTDPAAPPFKKVKKTAEENPETKSKQRNLDFKTIKLSLAEPGGNPEVIAIDEQTARVNYFKGNDPKRWKTNIPTYGAVLYKEIHKGIDVKFYGNNRTLEYDVIVRPGADPSNIKFSYDGIEMLRVTDAGELEAIIKDENIYGNIMRIIQSMPYAYQQIDGKEIKVEARFRVVNKSVYTFEVGPYDKGHELIIDPCERMIHISAQRDSTDYAIGIAVGSDGSAYVTGWTNSADFPVVNAVDSTPDTSVDAFVARINPSGSALVYSTYLGGSKAEEGWDIAVTSEGSAYVTGFTNSADFPVMNAIDPTFDGTSDAFVARINPSGSTFVYSTYLGGSKDDWGYAIAVGYEGSAYVTGRTDSGDFPVVSAIDRTYNGAIDAFVARIDPSGSALVYSTYLGGSNAEESWGIAVDSGGSTYVTGQTLSVDFPAVNAINYTPDSSENAFVAKIGPNGSALIYSTYLGEKSKDYGIGIAAGPEGSAYLLGNIPFSIVPAAYDSNYDTFIIKVTAPHAPGVPETEAGSPASDHNRPR